MHALEISPTLLSFDLLSTSILLAYLDPGSGSFILQLIIAGAAGILFSLRSYWSKIIARITKKGRAKEDKNSKTNAK